jgi:hypothetical protein
LQTLPRLVGVPYSLEGCAAPSPVQTNHNTPSNFCICIHVCFSRIHCTFTLVQNSKEIFFWEGGGDWGLNSGLCTCKVGTLSLEPHLQTIFALVILEMEVSRSFCPSWPRTAILLVSAFPVASQPSKGIVTVKRFLSPSGRLGMFYLSWVWLPKCLYVAKFIQLHT